MSETRRPDAKELNAGAGGGGAPPTGGVVRDMLSAEVPLTLRRDIYATAAIAGAVAYLSAKALGMAESIAVVAGVVIVVALRLAAITWGLQLPIVTATSGTGRDPPSAAG